PSDIDNAVAALGGSTHATDLANSTIQSQKAPVRTAFMSDVEQVVVQLSDVCSRFESVMNETDTMSAEERLSSGYLSESRQREDVEVQTGDGPDSPLVEDNLDVLLAPVRRGREGYDFEAAKPELKRKQPPYNPGGWL
ncbi:hypothetical protein CTAM01_17346, partial [Colletotrichum tamarilloi]